MTDWVKSKDQALLDGDNAIINFYERTIKEKKIIMKIFCPNCEKETDSELTHEIYYCKECDEDNGNYEKPMYNKLKEIISNLINDSNALAEELRIEQNSGHECSQLVYHKVLISKIIRMQIDGEI